MSVLNLLVREIGFRKVNFLLGLIAITVAVGAFVASVTLSASMEKEASRLMRDMGFNIQILPIDTNMVDFWAEDFGAKEMPEAYVHTLSESGVMTVRHLLAVLVKKTQFRGRSILLKGALEEVPVKHRSPKGVMIDAIPAGKAWVGFEIAQSEKLKPGDTITIGDKELEISECLAEKGSKDDITIFAHLHDVQKILGKDGLINRIEALECKCKGPRLATIRKEIGQILPDTRVTEFNSIAVARAETREMVEKYAGMSVPAVLVTSGLWIGLLALGNVRQRRQEIGLLRAIGFGSGRIASLFLGKALLLGLMGAALGYFGGVAVAQRFGPEIFPITGVKADLSLLWWSMLGAPLLCALASYLPAMSAVLQDPAVTLVKE